MTYLPPFGVRLLRLRLDSLHLTPLSNFVNRDVSATPPLENFDSFFKNVKMYVVVLDVFFNYVKNVYNVTTSKNLQKINSSSIL